MGEVLINNEGCLIMEVDWKRARRSMPSRWNQNTMKTYVPGVPVTIPPCSDDEVLDAIQLRIRLDEVQFQISTGLFFFLILLFFIHFLESAHLLDTGFLF